MTRTSSLQVVPGVDQALTPQQKKFNTLMQRIAKQRDLLQAWEAATALFRQRYVAEIVPLEQQELRVKAELVKLFDCLSEQKLVKADREHLQALIGLHAHDVLASLEDEEERALFKAIYSRHSAVDYDTEQTELDRDLEEAARAMAEKLFGVKLDSNEPATPDAVLRKLQEQVMEQQAEREAENEAARPAIGAGASASKQSKKNTARERQRQAAEQQISQSVREIYRKLASSLHPDRETDPVERERKTVLMQRVNQAYNAGQLLQLLELQLEIEQIDTDHIAGLSEERLKHYNQVLGEQYQELKQEVDAVLQTLLMEFQLSPFESYTPKKLGQIFSRDLASRMAYLQVLSNQLQIFTETPQRFKSWLKEDRALKRAHDLQQMEDSFSFFY